MSLDRRMQYFIEKVFPIVWNRFQIPVELTYPSKPSDFKCKEISPELIELCSKAIWVQSKIVFHHWIQYMRKYYDTMVSSPKAFVTYVTFACNVMAYNTKDHYDRFVTVCSLLAGFGVNFFHSGNGEVIQYIPKILAVFFEKHISVQFNIRGGWKRLDKYLLRQDYISWHDETQIDFPDETKDQKLARQLNFSKKVEIAIKATYSPDYDVDVINVKDIENDLETVKVTEEVMEYFPGPTPRSLEECQDVKKSKDNVTDHAFNDGEAKRKIVENLVEFVKRSRSALETNQQTENDGSSTQQQTETTNAQNDPEKTGVGKSASGKVQAATSSKRRSSKNNKQDVTNNSKNFKFSENLSLFCLSSSQSSETTIKQTETAKTSIKQTTHVKLNGNESVSSNRETSKETNPKIPHEEQKDESVVMRKTLKTNQSTSTPYSVPEASNKKKTSDIGFGDLLSSNNQNSKDIWHNTEFGTSVENNESSEVQLPAEPTIKRKTKKKRGSSMSSTTQSEEKSRQNTSSVNLECIQSSSNQQSEEIEQKNLKKTEGATAFGNQQLSEESNEPKSCNLGNVGSVSNNGQPTDDKEIKFETVKESEPSTKETKNEANSNIIESASISNTQKVNKQTSNEGEVKSISDIKQLFTEHKVQTANTSLKNGESDNHLKSLKEKWERTLEKTQNAPSSTISTSKVINSKKEAVAEIKSITESLAPKLEEFAVVVASLLWDLRHDI